MQVFIKDTKSKNGTFVNGDQLSPSGGKRELRTDDVVEFGGKLKSKSCHVTKFSKDLVL